MAMADRVKSLSRTKTTPIAVSRSTRMVDVRALSSLPAGKMVPLVAFPLLREDRLRSSQFRLSFEMMETVETLMNAVNVSVKAYLVPHLAHDRFSGMDELNRSYEGIANQEGGQPTPYFTQVTAPAHGVNQIHKYLGIHSKPGDTINAIYTEAYNEIWEFRAKNRSKSLGASVNKTHMNLRPAFWQHDAFKHIVPDFDQAVIDGEVALNVVNQRLDLKGFGLRTNVAGSPKTPVYETAGQVSGGYAAGEAGTELTVKQRLVSGQYLPDIWAEMQANGITVSLSNIELARKTQAYAEMRKEFGGHENYIIDLLMDGITVPEQAYRQPILLADKTTVFGMSKRYASDSGNLTDSVVSGATYIDLDLATPVIPCGGVIMIVAEITPEQLFERQRDPMLYTTTPATLPQYLRDTLDPEKVDVVRNQEVDTSHGTPNGTFGYAPLNWKWANTAPKVGGKFYRPEVVTAFDEDRQRIWAVETINPTLSTDFYICTAIHTKPFVVTNQDIGETLIRGSAVIEGLTVFGPTLIEANGDYAEVLSEAPQGRIVKGA